MDKHFFVSICIPSYNRPGELRRLIESIDTKLINDVQIVICEDKAPKRTEVRAVVEDFIEQTRYNVKYIENHENLGHGKNLRECIKQSEGEYVIFMGDDDMFIPEVFDIYFTFLKEHRNCGYILRSSRQLLKDGNYEYFRYYKGDQLFSPGVETYTQLFLKSVFMSGFTIKRDLVKDYTIDCLDDTLLFQLYLLAEVCLQYPAAYCNTPIVEGVGDGTSFFGTNKKEKGLYTPGVLVTNNMNFINGFFKITNHIDTKHNINSTNIIKNELSKYSFPLMSYTRGLGRKHFKKHCHELGEMGLDCTIYFKIYYFGLLFFGEVFCKNVILLIKKILGRRISL
ncbi:MAG: glycosyltransferase family 2 protein [Bacteroidetes bacterium]|nr:glycosyltransferase family 2 protein [Bacteroidota bacterium]